MPNVKRKKQATDLETFQAQSSVPELMEGVEMEEGYDLRFNNPCSFLIVGSTQAGKTSWTLRCLQNISKLFRDPRCAQNVIYFYNTWQNAFEQFDKLGIVTEWVNEYPTRKMFEEKTDKYKNCGGSVVVIDDFMTDLKPGNMKKFRQWSLLIAPVHLI